MQNVWDSKIATLEFYAGFFFHVANCHTWNNLKRLKESFMVEFLIKKTKLEIQ